MLDYEMIISKLKKLKELAERGVINEKEVALEKLKTMLAKYNIDISELDTSDELQREFTYSGSTESRDIYSQVIVSVVPTANVMCDSRAKKLYADMNYSDFIECIEKYKYYWKLYRRQKETFLLAFIHKNHLHPPTQQAEVLETEESKNDMTEVLSMMNSMEEGNYVPTKKMIEN